MTEFEFKIPADYKPLDELVFCSNTIRKSRFIINDNGFIPLLIGKGENSTPRIWLFAKEPKYGAIPVIEDNVSNIKQVKFDHYQKSDKIEISFLSKDSDLTILKLLYEGTPKITQLDLRQFGYNIQGNNNYLSIGGTQLKGNYFEGLESVIAFDSEEANQEKIEEIL